MNSGLQRAQDRAFLSQDADLRQAEIEQLRAGLRHQNIRRLEVAMSNSLAVGAVERIRDLDAQTKHLLHRQRTFQNLALDVFHHEVVRADVMQRADVRMIQRGHGLRLPSETLAEALGGDLDGYDTVEPRV